MSPYEIRRRTAEKMAQGPKPQQQQPIEGTTDHRPGIPASCAARLKAIHQRCARRLATRQAASFPAPGEGDL